MLANSSCRAENAPLFQGLEPFRRLRAQARTLNTGLGKFMFGVHHIFASAFMVTPAEKAGHKCSGDSDWDVSAAWMLRTKVSLVFMSAIPAHTRMGQFGTQGRKQMLFSVSPKPSCPRPLPHINSTPPSLHPCPDPFDFKPMGLQALPTIGPQTSRCGAGIREYPSLV